MTLRDRTPAPLDPARPVDTHAATDLRTAELLQRCEGADLQTVAVIQEEVVLLNLGIARTVARRYAGRGETYDDLLQVASLGLVKAVRGYDPSRGSTFLAYAVPTVTGEVKRHFRDRGWDIRPPRRVQELRPAVARAREVLGHQLERSPTVAEVARHLQVDEDDVIEVLSAAALYSVRSLDAPAVGDDGPTLAATVPDADGGGLDHVVDRLALRPLLAGLPPRDQHILRLRFDHGWTQSQIAADVGVTQMQVSRLLTRVLARLREQLTADQPATLAS